MAKFGAYDNNATPADEDLFITLDVSDTSEDPAGKTKKLNLGDLSAYIAVSAGAADMVSTNNLSDVADAATSRINLGLGTAATTASTAYDAAGSAAAAQAASQPLDADLTTIAAAGNGAVLAASTASFLVADESKLDGIEASADVTDTANVTAAGALMDSEVTNLAQVKAFDSTDYDPAGSAAAAQAASQPLDAVLTATTASFLVADESKLDGIEASADVTDTTNVTAAGALMDSEVTNLAQVKAFDTTDYATAAQGAKADTALQDVVDDTTPTLGGALDAATNSITNVGAVEEEVNTVATSGATETLDVSAYGVHDVTMDQACTFTFSNPAPSGDASSFVLILRGAFTPTLPASVDWSGGAAPTYTTPSMYVFTTVDAGTTWLGAQSGSAFA
jgi:hypothetical protein